MYTIQISRWTIKIIIGILAILSLVFLFAHVQPDPASSGGNSPVYSISAMACTPNGSTVREGLIDSTHGNARFVEGRSGTAYLICPFTDASLHGTFVSNIQLTSTASTRITVALRATNKKSGDVSSVLSYDNDAACIGTSIDRLFTCGGSGNHQLDFNANFYYVQITLLNSSNNPQAFGVTIN